MKNKVTVAVVDSGIDPSYSFGTVLIDKGIGFIAHERDVIPIDDVSDKVGHGTGVASIIHNIAQEAAIVPVKIFENQLCDSEVLIAALKYIDQNVDCDIINISLGVTCCDNISNIYNACKVLKDKGIIIVSAFDNRGLISYPAAFDCVIGIDSNLLWRKASEYTAVLNGEIDYIGFCSEQRVRWKDNTTQVVSGTSFTAAYFTGKIAAMLQGQSLSFEQIKESLTAQASRIVTVDDIYIPQLPFKINKAIAFPFNKEMHSIARYRHLLEFDDIEFFDLKFLSQIGKRLDEWDWGSDGCTKIIRNYETINWNDDFDTFILSHVNELEKITGTRYVESIVENCIKYHKKLYAFFDIDDRISPEVRKEFIYFYPKVKKLEHKRITYKTFDIGVPVLGVVGTSPRQGKFTIQLALRQAFTEAGYKVGQLGTEPSSLLFGMDSVYPMGYEGSIDVQGLDAVYTVNRIMGYIQSKKADIILTGTQSRVHTLYPGGYSENTTAQYEFLLGCQSDAYILCVNAEDPLDDISETIKYLESIYNAKVLAIVLSPISSASKWSIINTNKNKITPDILACVKETLSAYFTLPVYILNKQQDVLPLMDLCVEYFAS